MKEIRLVPLDSELWEKLPGAYGSMAEDIAALAAEPDSEKLAENVYLGMNHQMSFYPAVYIALPHLAQLLDRQIEAGKVEWAEYCLFNIAMTIASDNRKARVFEPGTVIPAEVKESYRLCVKELKKKAKAFYRANRRKLTHKGESFMAKLVYRGIVRPVYWIGSM